MEVVAELLVELGDMLSRSRSFCEGLCRTVGRGGIFGEHRKLRKHASSGAPGIVPRRINAKSGAPLAGLECEVMT